MQDCAFVTVKIFPKGSQQAPTVQYSCDYELKDLPHYITVLISMLTRLKDLWACMLTCLCSKDIRYVLFMGHIYIIVSRHLSTACALGQNNNSQGTKIAYLLVLFSS